MQAKLYPRLLAAMKPGATLGLSHGFLLGVMKSDGVDFRKDINVVLVAPKVHSYHTHTCAHEAHMHMHTNHTCTCAWLYTVVLMCISHGMRRSRAGVALYSIPCIA